MIVNKRYQSRLLYRRRMKTRRVISVRPTGRLSFVFRSTHFGPRLTRGSATRRLRMRRRKSINQTSWGWGDAMLSIHAEPHSP